MHGEAPISGTIRKPAWLDKHHSEWPPEARIAFGILADIAQRRLSRRQRLTDLMASDEAPAWITQPIIAWPPEYRSSYEEMSNETNADMVDTFRRFQVFMERCKAEAVVPGAAEKATRRKLLRSLAAWFDSGIRTAHGLDARLATEFGISLSQAASVRKDLGFVPAYRGGPIAAPKEE